MPFGPQLEAALFREPSGKPSNALSPAARLRQTERIARRLRVRHVPALIALAPILERHLDLTTCDGAHFVEELQQADRVAWAATKVERAPRNAVDFRERPSVGVHRVLHVEHVANLPPIAVDGD